MDLHSVTQITDDPSANLTYASVSVLAEGGTDATPSTVDLAALTTFRDRFSGGTYFANYGAYGQRLARNGGKVLVTNPTLTGIFAEAFGGGSIVGSLQLTDDTFLQGTVTGNVTNSARVYPGISGTGVLTIGGNYTQTATGTLFIEINGVIAGNQYDRLVVEGTASLAGTLTVTRPNGFTPADADSFQILTYAGRTGAFTSFTHMCSGPRVRCSPTRRSS